MIAAFLIAMDRVCAAGCSVGLGTYDWWARRKRTVRRWMERCAVVNTEE